MEEAHRTKTPHEFQEYVYEHLRPSQEEKTKNAEVHTPPVLIREMLDKVPQTFWEQPHQVLDPCCGKGGFVIDLFNRFDKGLQATIPQKAKRRRVIVECCIHFWDITPQNVELTQEILRVLSGGKAKTYNGWVGDSLQGHPRGKFSLVVGNPPYQPPSNNKKGGKSLWPLFVEKAFTEWAAPGGIVCYIHPSLWRKPENKSGEILLRKRIDTLEIHGTADGQKVFKCGTRYDWYLAYNTPTSKGHKTSVRFEDGVQDTIVLGDYPYIPNFGWETFKKFSKLSKTHKPLEALRDSDCHTAREHVSRDETPEFCYKLLNSVSKSGGYTWRYSSRPHKNQDKKKVMFSNGGVICPFYDDGVLGATQGGIYILVDSREEGEKLVGYLQTDEVSEIIRGTKWSNFETCRQVFSAIPNLFA